MICVNYSNATSADSGTGDTSSGDYYESSTAVIYYNTYSDDCEAEIVIHHNYRHPQTREKQEHFYMLLISLIFNIYKQQYISRCMFSKRGFCGRVAKKRKGK